MSTNALIKVESLPNVGFYKHYDGYPEATLPWLEKFNKEFTEKRGVDPHYKFAQLVRSSAFDQKEFTLDSSRETGWGVVCGDEWVCHYEYILKDDGTVKIQE